MSEIVIHPDGVDGGTFGICGGSPDAMCSDPWWAQPHCGTCTCPQQDPQLEHGRWVTCRCGRTGILPDPGYEIDFLPPGSVRRGNTIVFMPPGL